MHHIPFLEILVSINSVIVLFLVFLFLYKLGVAFLTFTIAGFIPVLVVFGLLIIFVISEIVLAIAAES